MVNEYIQPIKITKLIVIEVRIPSSKVWSRGYTLQADYETINKLNYVMHHNLRNNGLTGASRISEMEVAMKIPEIITLENMPNKVDIVNGWGTNRGRFLMETTSYMGDKMFKTYLQGYTDYLDNTLSGMMDPKMSLHINSIISTVTMRDPVSNRGITTATEFYNVIPGRHDGKAEMYEMLSDQGIVKKLIRPEDIMTNLFLIEKHSSNGGYFVNSSDNLTHDQVSRKSNNEMFKYFKTVTNSFVDAKNIADNLADREEIFYNAQAATGEPDVTKNPFFSAVFQATGNYLISSIKLETLIAMDPTLRPTYVPRATSNPIVSGPSFMETDVTEDTMNPTPETLRATIVSNTLPTYMCEEMITNLAISITNKTGENIAVISDINSFIEGVDPVNQMDRIISKVINLLMPKITDGGRTLLEMFITADLLGDMTIGVSLYGGPVVVYRFPCYADSLYTPVVTGENNKNLLVNDFSNVLEQAY